MPSRPHMPPTAAGALGSVACAGILMDAAWGRVASGGSACMAPVEAAACAAAVAALIVASSWLRGAVPRLRRVGGELGCAVPRFARRTAIARVLAWFATGIALAGASSCLHLARWEAQRVVAQGLSAGSCTFTVRGDPSVGAYGSSSTVEVAGEDGTSAGCMRLTADRPLEDGAVVSCTGRIEPLDGSDWARSRFMKGEVASVDAVRVREAGTSPARGPVASVRARVLGAIDPERNPARSLVAGIVCGRVTELDRTDASVDFSSTGLTHLVAVSGSHLALIAALLQAVMRSLRLPPAPRGIALAAAMALYVLFTGAAPSAVRSVLMVGGTLLAGLGGRRAHPLSSLSLAVMLIVACGPGTVFDLGFQLSAASVLSILCFSRYAAYLLGRLGLPGPLAQALSLTLCAQLATTPLVVPVFGRVSLIAPVANLLAGPLMSALLVAGLVCVPLAALVPVASEAVLALPEGLANASIFAARLLAKVPFASVGVSFAPWQLAVPYCAAAALWLLWRDWRRRHLLLALLISALLPAGHLARWTLAAPAAVSVLDVGQADSILVRDGRHAVLVDAGVDDAVVDALARNAVYRLDAVVITHWDRDHWGGLPDLLGAVAVDRVLVAEGAADSSPAELDSIAGRIEEARAGDVIRVGGFSCAVVWPLGPTEGEGNADSLCLDVSYRGNGASLDILLTGDTERGELASYATAVGDIDVLKVGHHGSRVSVDAACLQVLDPELAIASAGEGNGYGHPSRECIEAVESSGAAFLCTKDAGDVVLEPARGGVRVRTSR